MIPKIIHYVWIGNANKSEIFYKCLESWKKNCPDFDIVEINEKNFDIKKHLNQNRFFKECYDRKMWAYVSDYMRVHYMYEHGGVYVDTDMELIKDISKLTEISLLNEEKIDFFIGYEDEKNVSVGIFGTNKHNPILKDVIDFYESDIWYLPIWTIPKLFTYILEKNYSLTEARETFLNKNDNKIVIYPKEYFYPYGFHEKYTVECITENTYGIHWWNESWGKLSTKLFMETKHLNGIKKIYKKLRIICRYIIKKS